MADKRAPQEEPSLRIHQTIARDLAIDILTGRYKPGEAIVGEIEASEALKVSRTAYREAARILTAKGLLESRPKTGTKVTPRSRWNLLDPDVLAWMFSGKPDESFIRDLFELRGIIEPAAAALAAQRRTQAQVAEMEHALSDMRRFTLATEEGRAADQIFHKTILAAADNEALSALASSVGSAVEWTTKFKQRKRKLPRDPLPDHMKVHKAIADRNPKAARAAMMELLELALGDMGIALR